MKNLTFKSFLAIFYIFMCIAGCFADVISGKVRQDDAAIINKHQILDSRDGTPIDKAKVSLPKQSYQTYTAKDGTFSLNTKIDSTSVLSVEKDGYRPYSLTIDENSVKTPLKLGIERSKMGDIQLETNLFHLGDDVFSETSANSSDFKIKAIGPYYSKRFKIAALNPSDDAIIVLGSVIGLDTKLAHELGQNKITNVYSSPAEIFFNGQKIGELNINGDAQEIYIPHGLARADNEITIKTGKNLFQHAYVDYDDMEIANIRIEVRPKQVYAKDW